MIKTLLTQSWGCTYPIVNASMTPAAGGLLARAVSEAGGFGMIGVNETWVGEDIRRECAIARTHDPSLRFGIGFFGWALERTPELLDVAIAQRPFLISISFLDVAPYEAKVHAAGIVLAAQVQTRRDAQAALHAGVDVLIAQGTEAGGHTGDVSTLTMLQIALTISEKPVLAAGGIATPQGLAAVLAAGAAGAWIGTPFLVTREANVTDAARERILAADETQTVLTTLFDALQAFPWPERFKGRALRNDLTDRWHGREAAALADPEVIASLQAAKATNDFRIANIYAGQSAGLLSASCSAAEVVTSLGMGAERVLRESYARLL
ncbi:MAG: nitronate monooxygenase [Candidatus Elarobacter sp.]